MTQKQIFLKNIVDSTMSIGLDQSVSVETHLIAFHFNNNEIKEISTKFEYVLKNSDTKYFFMITFYIVNKTGFFGRDKSQFYLRIDTRITTQFSFSNVGTDFITNETGDVDLLKRMFNFLNDRIEEKRIKKEEDSYLVKNNELVKFIDKSLSRDEKLKDLLQDK